MEQTAPNKKELRDFGLISSAIVVVLFGLIIPFLFGKALNEFPLWPWYFAAVLSIWALIHSPSLIVVYKPWMAFGHIMGIINGSIILSAVYYLMITPIGVLMHLLGKAPLKNNNGDSYRTVSAQRDSKHMEHPY